MTVEGVVDGPVYLRDLDIGPGHVAALAMLGREPAVHAEPADARLTRA